MAVGLFFYLPRRTILRTKASNKLPALLLTRTGSNSFFPRGIAKKSNRYLLKRGSVCLLNNKFSCWISIYLARESGVLEVILAAVAAQAAAIATVLRHLAAQTAAELLLISVLRIASAAQLIVGLVGLRVGPTKALLWHESAAEQRQETGAHLLACE